MKILNSISAIYQSIYPEYLKLQKEVDRLIRSEKKESWHYFSRVKTEQSYALKLETGRVSDVNRPEDFFACTLVVENLKELKNALGIVERKFTIEYRKPAIDSQTHKESFSFPFDDLRLYLTITPVDYLPENPINSLIFEMQVKTFLQHAWGIATHDLIYKSGTVSWSRERVAYQIRAMLEQAEVSISGVDQLSLLPELSKENNDSKYLNEIMVLLSDNFPPEALPSDLLRLSNVIKDILTYFRLKKEELIDYLNLETAAGRGVNLLNLSPYAILLQSILIHNKNAVETFFKSKYRFKKHKLFIPKEIDISSLKIEEPNRLIRT